MLEEVNRAFQRFFGDLEPLRKPTAPAKNSDLADSCAQAVETLIGKFPQKRQFAQDSAVRKFVIDHYRPFRSDLSAKLTPPVQQFVQDVAARYSKVPEAVRSDPEYRAHYLSLIRCHRVGDGNPLITDALAFLNSKAKLPAAKQLDPKTITATFIPSYTLYRAFRAATNALDSHLITQYGEAQLEFKGKFIQQPAASDIVVPLEAPELAAGKTAAPSQKLNEIRARIAEKKSRLASIAVDPDEQKAEVDREIQEIKRQIAEFKERFEGKKAESAAELERIESYLRYLTDTLLQFSSVVVTRKKDFFGDEVYAQCGDHLVETFMKKLPVTKDVLQPVLTHFDDVFAVKPA
jgi:hypothetical protein